MLTVCAAFHHFPNIQKFAEESERVMKKDGVLYIAEVYLPNEIVSLFENNGFVKIGIEINGKVQIIKLKRK